VNLSQAARSSPVQGLAARVGRIEAHAFAKHELQRSKIMTRIAAAALVACLMGATSALAQQPDNHHHNNPSPPAKSAGPTHGGPTPTFHPQGGPPGGFHPQGGPPGGFNPQAQNFHRNVVPGGVGVQGRPSFGAPGFRPGGVRPQYNAQFFPRSFNPGARFNWRGGAWYGPQGYSYRPWYYGQILPFGWFTAQWYINDYYDYQLPVPPYGYEWIRNGPDALLVNIDSGMVAEDVPGIFY
jgi:Ni/Co efflux regulator RcnB